MENEKGRKVLKKRKRRKFRLSPGMQSALLLLLAAILLYILLYFVWGC